MSQSFLDVVQQKRVLILLVAGLLLSLWVGWNVDPTWSVDETALDVHSEDEKGVYFIQKGRKSYLDEVVVYERAQLNPVRLETGTRPAISEEFVMRGDGA
ncbi:hypothetical protein MK139_08465, partial [bacterium]|nr:hypothetical protein [bacterium]